MNDTQRFFFSYSRQQLYFAEAVAHSLKRLGADVWFDLQQLEPGTLWQDDLQREPNESSAANLCCYRIYARGIGHVLGRLTDASI
jgi:hypothetical protein